MGSQEAHRRFFACSQHSPFSESMLVHNGVTAFQSTERFITEGRASAYAKARGITYSFLKQLKGTKNINDDTRRELFVYICVARRRLFNLVYVLSQLPSRIDRTNQRIVQFKNAGSIPDGRHWISHYRYTSSHSTTVILFEFIFSGVSGVSKCEIKLMLVCFFSLSRCAVPCLVRNSSPKSIPSSWALPICPNFRHSFKIV